MIHRSSAHDGDHFVAAQFAYATVAGARAGVGSLACVLRTRPHRILGRSENVRKFALFGPLRRKSPGEWGGSAHSPDPTAQSAAANAPTAPSWAAARTGGSRGRRARERRRRPRQDAGGWGSPGARGRSPRRGVGAWGGGCQCPLSRVVLPAQGRRMKGMSRGGFGITSARHSVSPCSGRRTLPSRARLAPSAVATQQRERTAAPPGPLSRPVRTLVALSSSASNCSVGTSAG